MVIIKSFVSILLLCLPHSILAAYTDTGIVIPEFDISLEFYHEDRPVNIRYRRYLDTVQQRLPQDKKDEIVDHYNNGPPQCQICWLPENKKAKTYAANAPAWGDQHHDLKNFRFRMKSRSTAGMMYMRKAPFVPVAWLPGFRRSKAEKEYGVDQAVLEVPHTPFVGFALYGRSDKCTGMPIAFIHLDESTHRKEFQGVTFTEDAATRPMFLQAVYDRPGDETRRKLRLMPEGEFQRIYVKAGACTPDPDVPGSFICPGPGPTAVTVRDVFKIEEPLQAIKEAVEGLDRVIGQVRNIGMKMEDLGNLAQTDIEGTGVKMEDQVAGMKVENPTNQQQTGRMLEENFDQQGTKVEEAQGNEIEAVLNTLNTADLTMRGPYVPMLSAEIRKLTDALAAISGALADPLLAVHAPVVLPFVAPDVNVKIEAGTEENIAEIEGDKRKPANPQLEEDDEALKKVKQE